MYHSDLFSGLPSDRRYDLIVANPPYVPTASLQELPTEYASEPISGLDAGQEGLDIITPLLAQTVDYLADDGIIVVEVGESEYALRHQFPQVPFLWLEFEQGGEGVFLLTGEQIATHQKLFQSHYH